MKVAIGVQCRYNSKRLKGKAFMTIEESTLLDILLTRMKRVGIPVYVLTATIDNCDCIAELASRYDVGLIRGEEDNVWDRYRQLVCALGLDAVVRVTADNPFTSIGLIKKLCKEDPRGGVVTQDKRTVPQGLKGELIAAKIFFRDPDRLSPAEMEHVTIKEISYGNVTLIKSLQDERLVNNDKTKIACEKSFSIDTEEELNRLRTFIACLDKATRVALFEGSLDLESILPKVDAKILKILPDRTDIEM